MRFGSVDPSEGFSCGLPDFYLHRYPYKTQLAEAVAFLHAHLNHVSLVTIDIGDRHDLLRPLPGRDLVHELRPSRLGRGGEWPRLQRRFESIYGSFGDPIAQVDDAFSNNDTTVQPDGLPLDVERICQ